MVDLTRMNLEAETPGLPGTQDSAGQQQSSAVAGTPHKAGVPIAAIAGAAAGGLAAMLIGMSYSAAPPKGKEKKRKCTKKRRETILHLSGVDSTRSINSIPSCPFASLLLNCVGFICYHGCMRHMHCHPHVVGLLHVRVTRGIA